MTRSGWAAWLLLAILATGVGLLSLRYALPEIPFAPPLPSLVTHRTLLVIHAVTAALALLLGPPQLLPGLRRRFPAAHRLTGRAYAVAVLVAGLTALPVATNAAGGMMSALGFTALGVAWLWTTGMGVARAVQGRIAEHRRWMIRSYALTAAAITLRVLLPASGAAGGPFDIAYPAIAWLCWVPNAIAAEAWLRAEARAAGDAARGWTTNGLVGNPLRARAPG